MPNTIYLYSVEGFYVGAGAADPDPLQPDEWLFPIGSTSIPPPTVGAHEVARFDGQAWAVVPDFSGVFYWLEGEQAVMSDRGVPLPDGASLTKPQELVDAEVADLAARTFAFHDMLTGEVISVVGNQDELTTLTLLLQQAQAGGVALVTVPVGGKPVTFLLPSLVKFIGEYAQRLVFAETRNAGVVTALVTALNTATASELTDGMDGLPAIGSKAVKAAIISLTTHADAFKATFPSVDTVAEEVIVEWIIARRATTPFALS